MGIYYFANQVYQLSYAWPIYREIGGSFIVRKTSTYFRFKRFLRGSVRGGGFLGTPELQKLKLRNVSHLSGVFLSQSNSRIHNDVSKSRSIFIGHGTGDKKYGGKAHTLESYQYLFVSGPKHMQKLRDVNLEMPEEKLIKTGNIRFDDYLNMLQGKNIPAKRARLASKLAGRKTVLYAPTWRWGNGTLKRYAKLFMKEITKEHNLIIRPHHFDAHLIPAMRFWALTHGIRNVYFSNPSRLATSDTMHDFLVSDVLISDTSSVLYEYLITGKPIIVANTDFSGLHTMPDSMNVMKIADFFDGTGSILDVVNKTLSNDSNRYRYAEMLNNCFYFNDGKSVQRAVDFIRGLEAKLK